MTRWTQRLRAQTHLAAGHPQYGVPHRGTPRAPGWRAGRSRVGTLAGGPSSPPEGPNATRPPLGALPRTEVTGSAPWEADRLPAEGCERSRRGPSPPWYARARGRPASPHAAADRATRRLGCESSPGGQPNGTGMGGDPAIRTPGWPARVPVANGTVGTPRRPDTKASEPDGGSSQPNTRKFPLPRQSQASGEGIGRRQGEGEGGQGRGGVRARWRGGATWSGGDPALGTGA